MVAKDTCEVTFVRPSEFRFQAGQYTQVAVQKLCKPDPKGSSRQFSIASDPTTQDEVQVVFRATGSGFKETLASAPVGTGVTIEQAAGSFLPPPMPTGPQVFVAGGVGIAPIISYLRQGASHPWTHPIVLLYGNRSPEHAAYLSELTEMAKRQRHMTLNCFYEVPTPKLFTKLSKRFAHSLWWIVGPPAMVATTVYGLQVGGIARIDIMTESFSGY